VKIKIIQKILNKNRWIVLSFHPICLE
jgi:hypothetical protein